MDCSLVFAFLTSRLSIECAGMAQPIFAHLLPPLDFCPSSWVRRDLVLEPEPKPIQISAVNGEPVRRLGFDMILIRKNKKVARHSRLSKSGMAADHRQILVLGSLKQQGKSNTLRLRDKSYL